MQRKFISTEGKVFVRTRIVTGTPEMKAQSLRLSLCVARRPTCHCFLKPGVNNALSVRECVWGGVPFEEGGGVRETECCVVVFYVMT